MEKRKIKAGSSTDAIAMEAPMPLQKILFATNRKQLANGQGGLPRFGDVPHTPFDSSGLICATATIDKIDTSDAPSGKIVAIIRRRSRKTIWRQF